MIGSVDVIAVVGFFGVVLVAIVGGLFIAALKVLKGGPSRKNRESEAEEAQIIQDIHSGLIRMEERVETLETLLLDRERKGDKI